MDNCSDLGKAMEISSLLGDARVRDEEIAELEARVEKLEWLALEMSGALARMTAQSEVEAN